MHALDNHIARFQQFMNARGYDGHFLCNTANPGKLEESIMQHLSGALPRGSVVPPFFLTTYSLWKDEESPHVKCDFKMRYNHREGFQIERMDITKGNRYGEIKSISLPIASNTEIPGRQEANRKVLGKERKLKIR